MLINCENLHHSFFTFARFVRLSGACAHHVTGLVRAQPNVKTQLTSSSQQTVRISLFHTL